MSRSTLHLTVVSPDSHPFSVENAVAGLAHELNTRAMQVLEGWLFAMSDQAREVEQDTQLTVATIKEAQLGSGSAFGKLVEQYQQCIGTQMRRFTRDRRVCEDLTHDVFVEAYFSLRSFRFDAPFVHWLRRIAVRVGYRYWKTEKRDAGAVSFDESQTLEAVSNLTGQSLTASEAAEQVHWLLSQLSSPDRLVLTVVYLDGCSIKEAAFRCGWTTTGTKLRLFRARKKMISLIKRYES